MSHSELPRYRYRIDADDTITHVNDWWLAFARENGAIDLTEAAVVGRCLWNFIQDPSTKRLYKALHQRLRSVGKEVWIPFRCDSPGLRRYMRLHIMPAPEGALDYVGSVIRVEARQPLSILDPNTPRSSAVVTLCSCCRKILIEPQGWCELEDAIATARLFEGDQWAKLRNSVCSSCAELLAHPPENGDAA